LWIHKLWGLHWANLNLSTDDSSENVPILSLLLAPPHDGSTLFIEYPLLIDHTCQDWYHLVEQRGLWWVMVFNATFNNISVISWQSVLLVVETGAPGENHQPTASHWQTLSHNVALSTPRLSGIQTHNVSDDRHWLHW
jgi:hypothetical protein